MNDNTNLEEVTVLEYIHDAEITAKIKAKFAIEDILTALDIHVETNNNGIVVLTGHGYSQEAQNKAKEIAEKTDGVRTVYTSWEQESILD